ncbi:uncharacterized protein LOC125422073 [Ziziphus jujuba]|uniref:Uncharacterized protein LOC125422073 n=1 Tax=Ziziphus jujuba TaxID=326968 RepID=A0ABM3IHH1_ZIZJJ|nr:uncharacterized protein LOC125422073 [Ziziphus jujuba]
MDSFLVDFQYEKLTRFYFIYGLLGHLQKDCHIVNSHTTPQYGAWLRANSILISPKGSKLGVGNRRPESTNSQSHTHDDRTRISQKGSESATRSIDGDLPLLPETVMEIESRTVSEKIAIEKPPMQLMLLTRDDSGRLMFPAVNVHHLISSVSDHCLILLGLDDFGERNIQFGKRFHFEAIWTKEIECEQIIGNVWGSASDGLVPVQHLLSRLAICAQKLRNWNKYNFGQITHELKECHHSLASMKLASGSTGNFRQVRALEHQINGLLEKEEIKWKQRSRLSWLREGDRNTRFFHNHASSRQRCNTIIGVTNGLGIWDDNPVCFPKVFLNYFDNLFSTGGSLVDEDVLFGVQGRVSDEMNLNLSRPFTADEVKASLFQMHPTKAPGCDGMPTLFFQEYWPIVGPQLTEACLDVLKNNGDVSMANHT